jgi:hypothetical protein
MNRNYEEMKLKVEKVMQESIDSIENDINFFQQGLTKLDNEKPNDANSLLLKAMFAWFQNFSICNVTLYYLQKESMLGFIWAQEQIENMNERFEKTNPEDTIEIESKLKEMHNKFESTLGTLSSRMEKMNQEEEELKKKMKDNMFYRYTV